MNERPAARAHAAAGPGPPPRARARRTVGAPALAPALDRPHRRHRADAGPVAAIIGGAVAYHEYERITAELPTVDGLLRYQPPVMSRIYAGDDRLIAELAKERRIFIPFTAIPDVVKQAFVSAEDQNFWTHKGVDPGAIARAAFTDLVQIGKGPPPDRRLHHHAAGRAQHAARQQRAQPGPQGEGGGARLRIEATLSKERILELYLNEIYFGLQSYGVAAAAQSYFNKSLDQITLPEAAFLASLPKAPNNYNPFRFPDAARARRDWVLDRMVDDKAITAEQAAAAKTGPVVTGQFHRPEVVAGSRMVRRGGAPPDGGPVRRGRHHAGRLVVRTSFDPALQALADQVLRAA